jgi:hypothetical protein
MKAESTKNGNIKLTLDIEQASHLLSLLYEACFLTSIGNISEEIHSTAHDLWEALEFVGVEPADLDTLH